MIRQAVLYLAAPEDLGGARLEVAGRPVAFRAIVAARRAGARLIGVPASLRSPALARAVAASPGARAAVVWLGPDARLADEPTLLVPAAAVVAPSALAPLLAAAPPARLAASGEAAAPVLTAGAPLVRALAPALESGTPLGPALRAALARDDIAEVAGEGWYALVRTSLEAEAAEARLYAGLGRPVDTRLDVLIHRRLSRPVSRLAVAWSVTPNQVSLASLAVGLAAAWCLSRGEPAATLAALVLYGAAVVLDHADGEVARLTLAESRLGAWLDVAIDSVVHASLVVATGVAAERLAGSGLALGLAAAPGVVASALLVKGAPPAPRADPVGRLLHALGSRDGFYGTMVGFVVLAGLAPSLLPVLMAVVAVGANAFWLVRLADLLVVGWARPAGGPR